MRRGRRRKGLTGPDLFRSRSVFYVVSDSIGETAELVTRAALSQFNGGRVEIFRIPYAENEEAIRDVIFQAGGHRCIIVYTLVFPHLRALLKSLAEEAGIQSVDIMGPMMDALATIVSDQPKLQP